MSTVIDVIVNADNPIPVESSGNLPIDLLDRQEIIDQLIQVINTISDNQIYCTFALNGAWGTGKTFVLKRLIKQLLDYQDGEKFFVFHYNCWQYDYYEEPLVAIVVALLDSIDQETHLFSHTLREKAKEGMLFAKPILEKLAIDFIEKNLGIDVAGLKKLLKDCDESNKHSNEHDEGAQDHDKYYSFRKAIISAQEDIRTLTRKRTVVVIVDELDRCLPSYAVKVIERLHHLFSELDNCAVVLAVDKPQLEHTIQQIFGANTDSSKYLKKFISFEIQLSEGRIKSGFEIKYADYFALFDDSLIETNFSFEKFFSAIFAGIDIRTQERIMDRTKTVHCLLFPNVKKDYSFMCMEIMWLIFTEYRKFTSRMPIIFDSSYDAQCFCIPGNSFPEFSEYMKAEWSGIDLQIRPPFNNEKPFITFSSPLDIPQLLVWYLCQMYLNGPINYQINCTRSQFSIYNQNLTDLKKFIEMLTIIS